MIQSQILSKLSRLGLLSVFCAGLFLTSGELGMNNTGGLQIGNNGIQSVMAAVEDPKAVQATNPVDTTVNTLATLGNVGIATLTFLITPLIMLAGWLLSPDWTFGDVFLLRPVLHNLWILVSNVVYVIFGFLLVFVAFANIFGGEHAKAYEMKTMLPKLLTGMLMVPFTWFIVSGVLSVTNILTASVIQLPISTLAAGSTFLDDKIIPKNIWYIKGANSGTGKTTGSNGGVYNGDFGTSNCSDGGTDCISIKEILAGGGGAYNLLSVYAYGIFKIQDFKQLTPGKGINAILDIVIQLGFGTIFFIIFGILVIAIVYALFTRAIMLWLYAMFSPLFALNYVLGDKLKDKGADKFTIKEFVSLALVPVYVSAALAFGLLFLGAVIGITGPKEGEFNSSIVSVTTPSSDVATFSFLGDTNGVTLTTYGLLDSEASSAVGGVFNKGRGIIGTIIINTLALVVLWMAVMAALGASTITKEAIKPISEMGGQVGGLMKNAPQYVPIPGMHGQSMGSITKGTTQIAQDIGNIQTAKANEFNQKFGIAKYRELSSAVSSAGMEVQKISQGARGTDPNVQAAVIKISEAMKKGESIQNLSQQANFRDLIADFGGKIGVEIDKTKLATAEGLTEALKSIEVKLDGSGGSGLLGKMGSSVVRDDYDKFIKTGSGSGKDETGPIANRKGDTLEINTNAHNQILIDIKQVDMSDMTALANKLKANNNLKGQLTADEWKNTLQYIVTDESKRNELINNLGDGFLKSEPKS